MFRDFPSTLCCSPHRVAVALTISGRWHGTPNRVWHNVVSSPLLQGLEFARPSFQQGQFSQWKTAQSHRALRQGCRGGGAGLVTFRPPDTELSPLLCREQHCHGVAMFLWSPRLVAAPGQPQQLSAVLFLCSASGEWSFLSSLTECRPPGVQHG